MAHLEGYVSHIRFHNEENGYTVMEIETTHGDEVLVGNFHYINEGEYICAEGEYVDHPAHGPQYRMTSYTVKGRKIKRQWNGILHLVLLREWARHWRQE